MPIVNIPNVGPVNFPDTMSHEQILGAIERDIIPSYAKQKEEEPKKDEKPSLLTGTKLGPEEPVTPFNSPVGPDEMPVADISKRAKDWGLGETLLQSAKVGVPQLLQGASATGFRANADIINKIDTVEQQLAKGKKNFTIEEDPLGVADMTAEQRAKFRADTESALGNRAAGIAQRQAEVEAIPQNPIVQKVMKAGKEEGLSGFINEFKKDPVNFVAAIGPSSLVSNAPGMVAAIPATIAGGPAAGAAVMGAGSFAIDYPSTIISALAENGVDIKDPEALKAAAKDKELMDKVGKQAFAHASAVGAIDAISAGIASKVPLPKSVMKALENKPVARELTNIALQSPIQGTLGASGEALGQLAAGQQLDWGNIGAEFAGEFFGAPAEVVAVSAGRAKEVTGEKLNQRVEIKAKAAEDAAYKTAMSNILASKGFVFNSPQEQQVVVDTLAGETEVGGDKESRFTSLFNRLKEFNAAKEEEVGALVDSIKQKFIGTTPPDANQQQQQTAPPEQNQQAAPVPPTPPTTPPVISAEGTPIAPVPLDTAEKQAEAKASAPIGQTTPAATATPDVQVETLAAKLMEEYGFSKEHALQVATEEIQHGTEQSNGVVPGTNQPSIPVPQNGLQPAGGNAALNVAGLANTVGATGVPGVRAESVQANEPSALTTIPQNLIDLHAKSVAADEANKVSSTPANKRNATMAARRLGEAKAAQLGLTYGDYLKESDPQAIRALDDAVANQYNQLQETPAITSEVTPAATAPTATKGKRGGGRKAIPKTPEQIALGKQTAAQQTKDNKAAIAAANQHAETLEQPAPERDAFTTQDAYLDASMQHRARRGQALDALHEISKGPQRDNAGGRKAKEALAHPSINSQERTSLQQRIENRKRQSEAQVSKAKQTTNTESNPKYEGFKTVQQAIKHILENGTAFEKFLVRRLQPFLKGVNLVIVRSADDIPNKKIAGEEDKTLKSEFNGANGMYATYKENGQEVRTIFLRSAQFGNMNYQGTNNTVFLHEALHAAINARINEYISMEGKNVPAKLQAAMDALHKTMDNARNEYADRLFLRLPISREVQEIFDITDGFEDLKEFVTYGITTDAMQQFLLESKGEIIAGQPGAFRSLFRGFVNAVRDLFNMDKNHTSALQDLLLVSESLMKYELQGPIKEEASLAKKTTAPKPKLTETERKLLASPENLDKGSQTIIDNSPSNPQKANILVRLMRKGGEARTKAMLASLSTNVVLYLSNRLNGPIHAIGDIDTYLTEMRGMQNRLKRAAMAKLEPLARFASKDPVQAQFLADTMHRATLNKFDPAKHASLADALRDDIFMVEAKKKIGDPNFDQPRAKAGVTARENKIKKGYEEWNKLNKEAKEHYVMVRDYYRQMFNLYRSLLDKKIKESGLSEEDQKNLMASIRQIYEDAQKSGVYFPLMRYGKHWVKIQNGTLKGTYLFENISVMEDFKNSYFPNWDDLAQRDKVSSGNDITTLRKSSMGTETAMLKNVFAKLEGKESLDIEALKDDIYQLYLMSSSEQSLKNRFIHRKGTAGFSSDIVRNFATSGNQYANQLSKLEYGEKLQNAMSAASKAVESTARGSKAGYYVAEINKRVKEELSPDLNDDAFNQAVKLANNATFAWMLTGYKQIANQMISLGTYGTSVLAANKNYSFKEVGEMMLKYSNLYKSVGVKRTDIEGNKHWASPSLLHSTYVRENPILAKAAEKMKEIGIADDTFVNSLTEIAKKPPINDMDSYSTKVKKVAHAMTIGGAAIATGERLSREIMFMSSFELAYNHSKDFDSAFKQAIKDTHEALFSYESFNKSRLSKHPVGKFVFQFQHYKLQATFFMFRNMAELAKPTDGHTRQEALIKLVGSTLGSAAFAGTDIMGYSVMCAFIDLIASMIHAAMGGGDDDDDEDWVKFRAMGADAWFRLHYLPTVLGEWSAYIEKGPISAATGIDFSASIGTDNMWFKDLPHKRSFTDSLNAFLVSIAGAPVSMAANVITGVHDLFTEADKLRAVEKASPAFIKGLIGAVRQGTEGEKTKQGDVIKEAEKFGAFKMVAKSLGFQDTEVAQVLEKNYTLKGLEEAGNEARDAAYKKMGNALDNEDMDAFHDVKDKYQASVYGQIAPMTKGAIVSFAKNHVKNQAITEQGLRLSKPYRSFFEEEVTNSRSKEYK